jgi:hypothetical protein
VSLVFSFWSVSETYWKWLKIFVCLNTFLLLCCITQVRFVAFQQYRMKVGTVLDESRHRTGWKSAPYRMKAGTVPDESRHRTGWKSAPYRMKVGTVPDASRHRTGCKPAPYRMKVGPVPYILLLFSSQSVQTDLHGSTSQKHVNTPQPRLVFVTARHFATFKRRPKTIDSWIFSR